jgi:hypothetical protein
MSRTPIRTVAQKMGIRENSLAHLRNVPDGAHAALSLPALRISPNLTDKMDYLHIFVTSRAELDAAFPVFRDHLAPEGMLWVSWPKGGRLGTDLSLHEVVVIGYRHGLVESTCLSVNETWSVLEFTHPKAGKTYNNSHARLNRAPDRKG